MNNQPNPTPRRKGLPWWGWVLIAAGSVIAVCMVGGLALALAADPSPDPGTDGEGGTISHSDNEENPPIQDVTLSGCELGEYGWATATLEVTNNSSKASSYSITVEVVDGDGNRLEELFTFIDALRPDQSTTVEAGGLEDVADTEFSCVLLQVERLASEQ